MNKDAYDRLTDEEKKHLKDLLPVYFFYNTTDGAAQAMSSIPPENLLTLSAEDQATLTATMQPMWDAWVAKADAKGWPGKEILDETVRLMKLYDHN
jgi:hypothetical protein